MTKLVKGNHTIRYACKEPILVSVDGQPIGAFPAGCGKFNLRNTEGKLEFDPPKAKVRIDIVTRENNGEVFDDVPPPQPAPPPNYLAALRQKVKMSMGITREAFAEHRSIYEVIDDLETFEEDRQVSENEEENQESGVRQPDTVTPPEEDDKPKE